MPRHSATFERKSGEHSCTGDHTWRYPTTHILNLSNLLKGSDIKRTSRRTVLLKGSDIKRTSRRTVLLKDSDIKRTSRRTVLLKGSDIKRTSRRTVLLKGRNTSTIQLPLRHKKGIGIGRNDPAVWLAKRAAERKRYRRGHRTTTNTKRYVMACCIALALKSYRKMCMQTYVQHACKGSAQNHSLHM